MKVIVLGTANKGIFFPSASLEAMPGDHLHTLLNRLRGRKLELKDYARSFSPRGGRIFYTLVLKRRAAGREVIRFSGRRDPRISPEGSAFSIAVSLAKFGADVSLTTPIAETPRDFFEEAQTRKVHLLPSFGDQIAPLSFIIWGLSKGEERSIVFPFKTPSPVLKTRKTLREIRAIEGVTCAVATGIRRLEELRFVARVFAIIRKKNPKAVTYFMPNEAVLSGSEKVRDPKEKDKYVRIRTELREVLRNTSVLQMNLAESREYLAKKEGDEKKSGKKKKLLFSARVHKLSDVTRVPIVIVTRGSRGAGMVVRYPRRQQYAEVKALRVKAIDTAGAGDAFTVGFLCGLALTEGNPFMAFQFAAFTSGKNIEKVGGYAGAQSRKALRRYLRKLRSESTSS